MCPQKLFNELDTDGDGLIDGGALHRGLEKVGCNLSARDVREFLAVSAVDTGRGAGLIDINEFIAALFDSEAVVSLHPDMVRGLHTQTHTHTHARTSHPRTQALSTHGRTIADMCVCVCVCVSA